MDESTFTLHVHPPEGATTKLPLEGELLIGRDPICNLVLEHPTVSGNHALLEVKGTSVRIEDLDSTNGTIVDEVSIGAEVWVRGSTVIRIGAFRLDLVAKHDRPERAKTAQLKLGRVPLDDRDRALIKALMRDWSDPAVRLPAPSGAVEIAEEMHLSRQEVNRRVARLESKLGLPTGTRGARRYHDLTAELLRRGLQPGPG